ncbi:MAG: SpoVA/SpoVAEb family sporulation membrane protein [Clostridia bacterium]|nr:SpoVA/SpoVAEb family sporulation membrane protein [Clostridia bacterium]
MMTREEYSQFVHKTAPKSNHIFTMIKAFLIGGLICCIGEGIGDIVKGISPQLDEKLVSNITTIFMIFLGALLTGIGWYDDIGNFAGAGSIIPITGFANSVVAPAMEYKKEGIVFGICSRMFVVAGPIIVCGVLASVFSGIFAYFVL